MSKNVRLSDFLQQNAIRYPERIAVETAGGETITYAALTEQVNYWAAEFEQLGIRTGSRVALLAPKSIALISVILGANRCGATYIPLDPEAPAERIQLLLRDLNPHAFVYDTALFPSDMPCQQQEIGQPGFDNLAFALLPGEKHDTEIAYILYTSGSTGVPKGVMISTSNALGFINWASETFSFQSGERFSAVAPFHFDLSVFDLYVCFANAGTLVLPAENTAKNSKAFAAWLSEKKITTAYCTPSVLNAMLHFGKPEKYNWENLKNVFFAGEVFPVKPLHQLMNLWPAANFYNLYGPTETNVCTWFPIPRPYETLRTIPYPIGRVCEKLTHHISPDGELWIAGENVTAGYFNRPEKNQEVFENIGGKTFYKTGDCVTVDDNGNLVYKGRIDRMIKKRGYRIEPGEVEQCLLRHPEVVDAAVLGFTDTDGFQLLCAFIVFTGKNAPLLSDIKLYCAAHLSPYMIPERIRFLDTLPKNSSGKTDYPLLANL